MKRADDSDILFLDTRLSTLALFGLKASDWVRRNI